MLRGNRVVLVLVLAAAPTVAAEPALAWGPQGHRVITRITMERLTPKARAEIKALLNRGDTLVDVCDWADHDAYDVFPRSGPWHYVNVPISAARYDARFCSDRGCVVSKIKEYRRALADPKTPFRERQVALLLFVHFVEDIHQPLHVGDNHDRGGNDTQVQFDGRGTNLHRVWDSDLLHHTGGDDRAWVGRAAPLLTPENVEAWSRGRVEDWADESLEAAKAAYRWPADATQPIGAGAELGDGYAKMAAPILRECLAKAGLRLADELNAIFH
jgi:hypothetical protein